MTTRPNVEPPPSEARAGLRWVCPFCALSCDSAAVTAGAAADGTLQLQGIDCALAAPALKYFGATPSTAQPSIDGQTSTLDAAIAAAARVLAASHQPLFGGLDCDVAGARALYPLACATGAICDPAAGAALMQTLRALQDRGGFTTTLAEVRTRADVIVFLGSPGVNEADFLRRAGIGEDIVPARHLAFVDTPLPASLAGLPHTTSEAIDGQGDLFDTTAALAGLVAGRAVRDASPALVALAERLKAATYGVIVWDAAALPAHGGLVIEMAQRIVASLNRKTRAAAFPLGGSITASTVNQVFAWLSGLPLRSRVGASGIEHEPLAFDGPRLLAEGEVDALLWLACFGPQPVPATAVPRIVIGHPSLAPAAGETDVIFIPVSTPGIGSPGHLFRGDGAVLMPLWPIYEDTLPTAASVLARITQALQQQQAGGSP